MNDDFDELEKLHAICDELKVEHSVDALMERINEKSAAQFRRADELARLLQSQYTDMVVWTKHVEKMMRLEIHPMTPPGLEALKRSLEERRSYHRRDGRLDR